MLFMHSWAAALNLLQQCAYMVILRIRPCNTRIDAEITLSMEWKGEKETHEMFIVVTKWIPVMAPRTQTLPEDTLLPAGPRGLLRQCWGETQHASDMAQLQEERRIHGTCRYPCH